MNKTCQESKRRTKLMQGCRRVYNLYMQQKADRDVALVHGGIRIIIPFERASKTGSVYFLCQKCEGAEQINYIQGMAYRVPHRIELDFFYTVWKCPDCGQVYVLEVDDGED